MFSVFGKGFGFFLLVSIPIQLILSMSSSSNSDRKHRTISSGSLKLLKLPQEEQYVLDQSQPSSYCLMSGSFNWFDGLFYDRFIEVELLSESQIFSWYSVKGISEDDFEMHVESLIYRVFGNETQQSIIKQRKFYEQKGFVRDILSSCPNPLFSTSQYHCPMRFSPLAPACVIIPPLSTSPVVNIKTYEQFSYRYLFSFLVGIFLLTTAPEISKSKIFQYLSGAIIFFSFGLIILVWITYSRILNPKSSFSLFNNLIALAGILAYGASIVWYLKTNFTSLLLDYWQASLVYTVCSSGLGLIMTRFARSSVTIKNLIIIAVEWFLRLIGFFLVYQSFSSPRIALTALFLLVVIYVFFRIGKRPKQKEDKYNK